MEGSLLYWLHRRMKMAMGALIRLWVGVSSAVEPVTSVVCWSVAGLYFVIFQLIYVQQHQLLLSQWKLKWRGCMAD